MSADITSIGQQAKVFVLNMKSVKQVFIMHISVVTTGPCFVICLVDVNYRVILNSCLFEVFGRR